MQAKQPVDEPQIGRHSGRPRHTLRWRFRGERAEATYAAVRERLRQRGWSELGRWGPPESFVVEFGGDSPPDWADTVLAAGSLR